jgi:hypothetical protein
MPVTIRPVEHDANPIKGKSSAPGAKEILKWACTIEYKKMANDNIVQSSFDKDSNPNFIASDNGFIDALLRAYDEHHHLKIRPEGVWSTILVQLKVYINENAEQLRSLCVQHEGQKGLVLYREEFEAKDGSNDWGEFAYLMSNKLRDNLNDPTL